jgi:hypothetical protein
MAPYELKGLTVKQLGEIRNGMVEPEYLWKIMTSTQEEQKESAMIMHHVQLTHLRMRNAELSDIRDKLIANEADLTQGIQKVKEVMTDLQKTDQILSNIAGFLQIVGRIITVV